MKKKYKKLNPFEQMDELTKNGLVGNVGIAIQVKQPNGEWKMEFIQTIDKNKQYRISTPINNEKV